MQQNGIKRLAQWWSGVLLVTLALLTAFASGAHAQSVREDTASGLKSSYLSMKKEAEEQHFRFPDVREGEQGTIARLSFDLRNADVTFFTTATYPSAKLLPMAKTIAQEMGLPQSDFITVDVTRYHYIDLEMNDYLQKVSRSETHFDFDLSRLRVALEKSELPRPIVLVIDVDGEQVSLGEATTAQRLTVNTFLQLEDIKPGTRLSWRATITWQMRVGAVCFAGLFLLPALMPFYLLSAHRKQREKKRREGYASSTPEPAKVQEAYDKQKPQWLQQLLLLSPSLLVFPFLFLLRGKGEGLMPFIRGTSLVFPNSTSPAMIPLFMVTPLVFSALLCFTLEWWRTQNEKRAGMAPPPDPNASHQVPNWLIMLPVLPMGLMMFVLPLMSIPAVMRGIRPLLAPFSQTGRFLVITGFLMLVTFGSMLVLTLFVRKKTRQDLKAGDCWYDETMAMAQEAGVKIHHVTVSRSPASNASISVLGTVNLTSRLLADFEPEEVRAVIAHEVGHQKASHPLRGLMLSLLVTFALLGVWFGGRYWLEQRFTLSTETKTILNMPLFSIFILPVLRVLLTGKTNRQHEFDADRFAVQITGDPELVVRTLRKVHTLNAQPHLLKKSDEMLQEHPSLANRIDAIRRDAGTAG